MEATMQMCGDIVVKPVSCAPAEAKVLEDKGIKILKRISRLILKQRRHPKKPHSSDMAYGCTHAGFTADN